MKGLGTFPRNKSRVMEEKCIHTGLEIIIRSRTINALEKPILYGMTL